MEEGVWEFSFGGVEGTAAGWFWLRVSQASSWLGLPRLQARLPGSEEARSVALFLATWTTGQPECPQDMAAGCPGVSEPQSLCDVVSEAPPLHCYWVPFPGTESLSQGIRLHLLRGEGSIKEFDIFCNYHRERQ